MFSQVGALEATYGVGQVIGACTLGKLSDRFAIYTYTVLDLLNLKSSDPQQAGGAAQS